MIASPNFSGRGGARVRLLVVHTTENNADVTPASNVANYFAQASSQVSSHVVIDDDNVIQCVDYNNAAWTCAGYNTVSENAEMIGYAAYGPGDWARHAGTIERTAQWLRDRAAARGIPLVYLSAADVVAGRSGWTSHLNLGAVGGGHHDPGDAAIAAITAALQEDDMPSADEVAKAILDKQLAVVNGQPITLSLVLQDLGRDPATKIAKRTLDMPLDTAGKSTLSLAAQSLNAGSAKVQVTIDQAQLAAVVGEAVKSLPVPGLSQADIEAACEAAVKAVFGKAIS